MAQPKITGYLKPRCGWSAGVRAVLRKYNLEYEDKDIINDRANYEEMVRLSGQPLSPCVVVGDTMLADIGGDELEAWLIEKKVVSPSEMPAVINADEACATDEAPAPAALAQIKRN